jgi:hypothetical protein
MGDLTANISYSFTITRNGTSCDECPSAQTYTGTLYGSAGFWNYDNTPGPGAEYYQLECDDTMTPDTWRLSVSWWDTDASKGCWNEASVALECSGDHPTGSGSFDLLCTDGGAVVGTVSWTLS